MKNSQIHNLSQTQTLERIPCQLTQTQVTAKILTTFHATSYTASLPIVAKPVAQIIQAEIILKAAAFKLPTEYYDHSYNECKLNFHPSKS